MAESVFKSGRKVALVLLLVSVGGLMLFQKLLEPTPDAHVQEFQCDDLLRGCTINLHGKSAEIKFSAVPNALHPFKLSVQMEGLSVVESGFAMAGMEMGPNRYRLKRVRPNVWEADVLLPVCVAGRRDWIMNLTLDNVSIRIPFAT